MLITYEEMKELFPWLLPCLIMPTDNYIFSFNLGFFTISILMVGFEHVRLNSANIDNIQ